MPFNGSGTYTLPAGNPVVNNTVASSTVHNNTNSDIATALSTCIAKDGQSTPTADIPMGGFTLTGLGDGTDLQDSANVRQLQNNGAITLSSVSGTDTITATASPVPAAYAANQIFVFEPAANNTGAATINISSLGAKDIYINNAAIGADVLVSGQPVVIRYNGTQFEIIGKADVAGLNAASNVFAGDLDVQGIFNTNNVTFPATAVPSADANTLDDYEEGTFTPVVEGTSTTGSASYTLQLGRYTKIGREVIFNARVDYTGGTGTGSIQLGGLPFTSANVTGLVQPLGLRVDNLTFSNQIIATVSGNSTKVSLLSISSGAGASGVAYDAAATIIVSGSYTV